MNSQTSQLVFGPLPGTTYQHQQPGQHHHHTPAAVAAANAAAAPPQGYHPPPPHPQQQQALPGAYPGHRQAAAAQARGSTFPKNKKSKAKKTNPANPNQTDMSQYETNPVGALQERFQSRGIQPAYRIVQAEGASHCPTFAYQCIIGDMVAMGTGNSKKQAKHNTARAMLDKLDGRVPAQDGLQPLPPVTNVGPDGKTLQPGGGKSGNGNQSGNANGNGGAGNTIGQLQELCVHKGLPMPVYDLGNVEGQPHQRSFQMKARVGSITVQGAGTSKKDAKRDAATKMMEELTAKLNLDKDGKSAGDDDELAKTIANMKIDTLTPEHSQKIQSFYRTLQEAKGSKLYQLHRTQLKGKQADFVRFLSEIGQEQKFEVTYVEIDDKSTDSEVHCLVQLSTLPVAVCYGVGADKAKANNEAARNALAYLKIMTKKPVQQNGK